MKENKILLSIVLIKLCILFYIIYYQGAFDPESFIDRFKTNDYNTLLGPVNNLIETGTYELVKYSGIPYTERLPGYMFPFILFRFFLSLNISILLLILYQVIISLTASYLLYQIAIRVSKNFFLSSSVFIIYNLFSFLIPWELWTVPESLSVSYYIIAVYFLYLFFYEIHSLKYLFFSGFFFSMVFFLRGFLFFNILSVIIFILLSNRFSFNSFKYGMIFIIPFLFFESLWIGRNYLSKDEFIPLTTFQVLNDIDLLLDENYRFDYRYKPSVLKLRKLISCWGGVNVHYYENSEMGFFINNNKDFAQVFPNWIFNCGISKQMLFKIQNLLSKSFDSTLPFLQRCKAEKELFDYIDFTINKFKYDSYYHSLLSSFKRSKNLIFNNIVADWPIGSFYSNSIFVKIYKILILVIYFLSILISLFLIPLFFLKSSIYKTLFFIIILNSILLLLVFTFIIDIAEFKYSATLFINSLFLLIFYSNKHVIN
tara:strand:+ start:1941 stop:3392 length:1452 start_codon:yes stop_codon:yes gene_type:complete